MDHLEDYIENREFVRWVFEPDDEINTYFDNFFQAHPELKEEFIRHKKELQLLSMSDHRISVERGVGLYQTIISKINVVGKKEDQRRYAGQFLWYAAVVMVSLLIGSGWFYFASSKNNLMFSEDLFLKSALYYPVIYFPDGSKNEITAEEKLVDLSLKGKIILGTDTIEKEVFAREDQRPCVVVIPNGQRLNVLFNDKSRVCLNSGSRLIFPSTFESKKREVYISGEGFFDISANRHKPFIVNTSTIAVKVLGTKFNLSSYPNDSEVVAVLEEGAIQIIDRSSTITKVKAELQPNQVAIFNKESEQIKISQADHQHYTMWKEGSLLFDQQQISKMIEKVERYYDIRIILKDELKGKEVINGRLDLDAGRNEVLEYIAKITRSKIRNVNNRIYILE